MPKKYVLQEYPKWVYPREGAPVLVESEAHHKSLKGEFKESPAEWNAPKTYREHMAEWESKAEKKAKEAPVNKQAGATNDNETTEIAHPTIEEMKAVLKANGFKETHLNKRSDEHIRSLYAMLNKKG